MIELPRQNKVVAIIQARLTSKRLPRKVLLPLGKGTVLQQVYWRVRKAKLVDQIVVAIPTGQVELAEYCRNKNIPWGYGSEDDVLSRFYDIAKLSLENIIVRLTADCPLLRPEEIDDGIRYFTGSFGEIDYYYNSFDGSDVEVFSWNALQGAYNEATEPYDREHVTPWMMRNLNCFIAERVTGLISLDTEKDYENIKQFYESEKK